MTLHNSVKFCELQEMQLISRSRIFEHFHGIWLTICPIALASPCVSMLAPRDRVFQTTRPIARDPIGTITQKDIEYTPK